MSLVQPDLPPPVEPLRYPGISDTSRVLLDTEGESGRFEFKRDSKALDQTVLVAAANWVALEPKRTHVTILVGIDEVVDQATGLTTGTPIGLPGQDLSVHARRIQSYAHTTLPVPVSLRIIEEAVESSTPFLRVEVRPTAAPHFDAAGRRVTRDGAGHRALMDEELLSIYLDREAQQFEARFASTARATIDAIDEIDRGLNNIASDVGRLPQLIDGAEAAAYAAGSEAEDSERAVRDLEQRLTALERRLAWHLNQTPLLVFLRLRHIRVRVWRAVNADRLLRPSKAAESVAPRLLAHLNEPIILEAHLYNMMLLQQWESAFEDRKRPSSMSWWKASLSDARRVDTSQAQRTLRDDLAGFREEVKSAQRWSDVELFQWSLEEL